MSSTPSPIASLRRILLLLAAFLIAVLLAYGAARWAQYFSPVPLGIGRWFPVAYGHPRTPSVGQLLTALFGVAAFVGAVRFLPRLPVRYQYPAAALIGFLAILTTTSTHGTERGFAHPVAGREPHARPVQYWHDAETQAIETGTDAARFIRKYNVIQPTLAEHGRTHPPGAVLFFAALRQASGNRPDVAAIALCFIAVVLVAVGFRQAGAPTSTLLLFCALPAVQVYFCATLDAVIAGLLFFAVVGSLRPAPHPPAPSPFGGRGGGGDAVNDSSQPHLLPLSLRRERGRGGEGQGAGGGLKTFLALLTASFLTFGIVWVVPVLLAVEIARTRRFPTRTVCVLLAVALFYVALYALTGFDYLAAFRFASRNENPDGFRLFANPVEYVATRIENIADLLVFAGPFALWAGWRGLDMARREAFATWVMFLSGVVSLLLLFLAGAYRTGETARACLFLYPLLALTAAHAPLSERDRETLVIATFVVSVILQCMGFFFW